MLNLIILLTLAICYIMFTFRVSCFHYAIVNVASSTAVRVSFGCCPCRNDLVSLGILVHRASLGPGSAWIVSAWYMYNYLLL